MAELHVSQESLVGFMNRFSALRNRQPRGSQPTPELLAARFGVTGMASNTSVMSITTSGDSLRQSQSDPYIRRDIDSVIGFSDALPVVDAINYMPYPNISRTLEKRLHIKYGARIVSNICSKRPSTCLISSITHSMTFNVNFIRIDSLQWLK